MLDRLTRSRSHPRLSVDTGHKTPTPTAKLNDHETRFSLIAHTRGEVAYSWHAKEAVRFFYNIPNPEMADKYLTKLAGELQDDEFPPEVRSLGRTLTRWRTQITNWHRARASNGPPKPSTTS